MNQLGNRITLTTFGESHGPAIGGIIDGFPSGIAIDLDKIQHELNRRKPGQSSLVTQRKENDKVEFLSGIFEGKSTGTPIGFYIRNIDQKSYDYSHIKNAFRPSHADFSYQKKYGIRDYRGGGRSSARETINWVVAGALAKQLLKNIKFYSYVSSVGNIELKKTYQELDLSKIDTNEIRCPDEKIAHQMIEKIKKIKKSGDSIGGTIIGIIQNVPIGLGEPIFNKLHAELGKAMLSINAAKGFEYGSGFKGTKMLGSEHNDIFNPDGSTKTNYSGGIQGGISNGMDIYFKIAFKPVATLIQKQETIDIKGKKIEIIGKGRHDPCVLPRAVPIVEALSAFVLSNFII